jgi:Domain of unknown function (DUF4281)
METIFQLSSLPVLPLWLLMILTPRWGLTQNLMRSHWVIVPPALLYSILVLPQFFNFFPILANPNLNGIATLLSSESGATIAWVHFLAFDLFVGRWIYLDNLEQRIHPVLVGMVLFLVLMFGPFGYLLYLGLRFWRSRVVALS